MRVLLDECVNEGLRKYFPGHDCQTARYAGFAGLENGQLLTAAAELQSVGEDKAKNSVCFLFALMVICHSRFSTGA